MEFLAVLIPLTAITGIFILPQWTAHQRKMMELRLQLNRDGDSALASELQALRHQIVELRDTTTRYDMSFDSALQRIESRVGNLEGRVSAVEQAANSQSVR